MRVPVALDDKRDALVHVRYRCRKHHPPPIHSNQTESNTRRLRKLARGNPFRRHQNRQNTKAVPQNASRFRCGYQHSEGSSLRFGQDKNVLESRRDVSPNESDA